MFNDFLWGFAIGAAGPVTYIIANTLFPGRPTALRIARVEERMEVAELVALGKKASKRPWRFKPRVRDIYYIEDADGAIITCYNDDVCDYGHEEATPTEADCAYIAAVVNWFEREHWPS